MAKKKWRREIVSVILAAGKGTRMRSGMTKLMHDLCGKPVVRYASEASMKCGIKRNIVVVGHCAEAVYEALGEKFEYVVQKEQLGTGHAFRQALPLLKGFKGDLLVFNGDGPFLTSEIMEQLISHHQRTGAAATILTALLPDPGNYGRIVRGLDGSVVKIVERKDASLVEYKINEVNSGVYCFQSKVVLPLLRELDRHNSQGEYYLTDVIGLIFGRNLPVETVISPDHNVVLGVNDRIELAVALKVFREKILEDMMRSGVTIMDPSTTYVDSTVRIGQDTIIYPFTYIERNTVVSENCLIGPHARLTNVRVGRGATIQSSVIIDSSVKAGTAIAPFTYLERNKVQEYTISQPQHT